MKSYGSMPGSQLRGPLEGSVRDYRGPDTLAQEALESQIRHLTSAKHHRPPILQSGGLRRRRQLTVGPRADGTQLHRLIAALFRHDGRAGDAPPYVHPK